MSTIFDQTNVSNQRSEPLQIDYPPYRRHAFGTIILPGSPLIGEAINKVSFYLQKIGSPTGTLAFRVYNVPDFGSDCPTCGGTLEITFGTLDVDTDMDNSAQYYIITGEVEHTLAAYDVVTPYYVSGTTDGTNNIKVSGTNTNINATTRYAVYNEGVNHKWGEESGCNGTKWENVAAATPGPRLPPPPIVLGGL